MKKLSNVGVRTRPAIVVVLVLGLSLSSLAGAQGSSEPPPVADGSTVEMAVSSSPDVIPPLINQPPDLFVAAIDASGAVVLFDHPLATDDVDGNVPVTCDWGSGAVFPLGTSIVTCSASDAAGNLSSVGFRVTVVDQTPPVVDVPLDVYVIAPSIDGAVVSFAVPFASDNVDGVIPASCDWGSGAFFPIGVSMVGCWAIDSSGNASAVVAFAVIVDPPPPPPPSETPLPTSPPTEIPLPTSTPIPATELPTEPVTPVATAESSVGGEGEVVATPTPTSTADGSPLPTASPTVTVAPSATVPTATVAPSPPAPTAEPVPAGLPLPWPLPGNITINTYGGPLNGIDAIWGYEEFPISQEFGHTEFSIANYSWYAYGLGYGLDGFEHPGLDIGMPAGTWLYSPVEGTVQVAGNSPSYTFYGNGESYVGHLQIVTDNGDEIVLGHMGRISVGVGERVSVGQFIGTSGGYNGDHLHLEVREMQQGGWLRAVDPRQSIIVVAIEVAAKEQETPEVTANADNSNPEGSWQLPQGFPIVRESDLTGHN